VLRFTRPRAVWGSWTAKTASVKEGFFLTGGNMGAVNTQQFLETDLGMFIVRYTL
jgi:hypothetical protein